MEKKLFESAKELIKAGKMAGTIKQDAEGMAEALCLVASNGIEGRAILAGADKYDVDSGVSKIRIAYSKYLG